MNRFSTPVVALRERTIPSGRSFPLSDTSTQVILATHDLCATRASELVGPGRPVQRRPCSFAPRSSWPSHRVWASRSDGVPRESHDAPEDLPKQAPCQVAFGQPKSTLPREGTAPPLSGMVAVRCVGASAAR